MPADRQLLITRCTQCCSWISPPEQDCPVCGGVLEPQPVSGRGTVFTFTVNHQPFNPDIALPYVIAIVELEEAAGLRLAANIVDCEPDSVRIGMPVEVRFADEADEADAAPVFAPRSA
jgi:uncharacterized protein